MRIIPPKFNAQIKAVNTQIKPTDPQIKWLNAQINPLYPQIKKFRVLQI